MMPQHASASPSPPQTSGLWNTIRGLLDRAVLVVSVLGAGTVPSFIAQYRQRVGGMLTQAETDLAPFLEIARRYHGGSLEDLIAHHRASSDPTFRDEGEAIAMLRDTVDRLRDAFAGLDADLIGQLSFLAGDGDVAIAKATWNVFDPAFSFAPDGLLFAVVGGFVLWLALVLVGKLLLLPFHPRH